MEQMHHRTTKKHSRPLSYGLALTNTHENIQLSTIIFSAKKGTDKHHCTLWVCIFSTGQNKILMIIMMPCLEYSQKQTRINKNIYAKTTRLKMIDLFCKVIESRPLLHPEPTQPHGPSLGFSWIAQCLRMMGPCPVLFSPTNLQYQPNKGNMKM